MHALVNVNVDAKTNDDWSRPVTALLLLAATVLVAGCNSEATLAPLPRPAIVTQPQTAGAQGLEMYSGTARARRESVLGFRIAGKVQARNVDVGTRVRKGGVLATLEPEDAALAVASAKAQFAGAKADLALAKAELDRHQAMLDKHYISQALFDARRNANDAAQARLDQAHSQFAVARNQAEYTTLRADHDGVITAVTAEAGQVVAAGQPVVSLAHEGAIDVLISVPESRIASFKKGQPVVVEIWADDNARHAGEVREIAPEADPQSRTYDVRVTLGDAGEAVQLGMTARVYLDAGDAPAALLLPLTAVTGTQDQPAVWVLDRGTRQVHLKPVRVGAWREDGVTVLAGIGASDWVIAVGVHKLVEGQSVRPVDAENKAIRDLPAGGPG